MSEEIWKDIPECEGVYQASNLGKVRSIDRYIKRTSKFGLIFDHFVEGKLLTPSIDRDGYCHLGNRALPSSRVHRLVAMTFLPNPDNLPQVNHKNGIVNNNCITNLEWCTTSYNHLHAYACLGRKCSAGKKKKTALISPEGEIFYFDSTPEAAKYLGVVKTAIMNAAKGTGKCRNHEVLYV